MFKSIKEGWQSVSVEDMDRSSRWVCGKVHSSRDLVRTARTLNNIRKDESVGSASVVIADDVLDDFLD